MKIQADLYLRQRQHPEQHRQYCTHPVCMEAAAACFDLNDLHCAAYKQPVQAAHISYHRIDRPTFEQLLHPENGHWHGSCRQGFVQKHSAAP